MNFHRYLMIGAGGTGSHFIGPALAYLNAWHRDEPDKWQFTIVDGDSYDTGNLERQMFDPRYIGVNKAQALAEMYSQYPIQVVPEFVGVEQLEDLMEEGITVFIAVDNYSVRTLIEHRAHQLDDAVVINAGNEKHDGSVQLWVRKDGENKTPRISYLHPEIQYIGSDDRAAMSCLQVAELPGGEQLIIANMAAAQHMVTALWRYHSGAWETGWTELQFDLLQGKVDHIDMRQMKNWHKDRTFTDEIFVGALPEIAGI